VQITFYFCVIGTPLRSHLQTEVRRIQANFYLNGSKVQDSNALTGGADS
jgi:hypothetical protein